VEKVRRFPPGLLFFVQGGARVDFSGQPRRTFPLRVQAEITPHLTPLWIQTEMPPHLTPLWIQTEMPPLLTPLRIRTEVTPHRSETPTQPFDP